MVGTTARLVGLVLLVLGLGAPVALAGIDTDGATTTPENTSIRSYVATFDVAADGDLDVTETLTVDFPNVGQHGIFRFWDVVDPEHPHTRLVPHDLTVTRDGVEEPFEMSRQSGGRYRVARIGSPSVTLPTGEHVYVVRFSVDGALTPGSGAQPTQLYWNLIPAGWRQPIDRADLTVRLPTPARSVRCAVGVGEGGPCAVTGEGTPTLQIRAESLPPFTPVTIQTGLDIPTPDPGRTVPWPIRVDAALGSSLPAAAAVALGAVVAGVLGYVLSRRTREQAPPFPLQYGPPAGVGPAQAGYVMTEQVSREAFVGSLLHAAERGAVRLDRSGDAWSVTRLDNPTGWSFLDTVTSQTAGLLTGPQGSFVTSRSDVEAGKRLAAEVSRFNASVASWARDQGLVVSSGPGCVSRFVLLASVAVAGWIVFKDPFGVRAAALMPGLFAVGAAELMTPGAGTRRTATGRDLWSRTGGFHRILSTPSAEQRFEFAGRQELYAAYLPWAVAFGCADAWADKYRTELATEPPVPAYFGGYHGVGHGVYASQMITDFSATVNAAISSYEATQSSDGGGGFSGGGGGGGGGGGSW